MGRRARIAPPVRGTTVLADGVLRLSLGGDLLARAGDEVSVHVGDHVVAGGALAAAPRGGFVAVLPIADVPDGEGPLEFRILLVRDRTELHPAVTFPDRDAFLTAFGPVGTTAEIAAFDGGHIGFRVHLAALRCLPRRFTLIANGRPVGTLCASVVTDPPGANPVQEVTFATPAGLLREGVLLELVDAVTDSAVFAMSLTWLALTAGVLEAHRRTSRAQARLGEELARLRTSTAALLDASRDQLLLERLDLYHAMLTSRLDREFLAIRRELGLSEGDGAVPIHAESIRIPASSFEGAGMYDVEWEGETHWRWFGPEATVLLRDLPENLLMLRVHCASVPPGVALLHIACRVNGVAVAPSVPDAEPPVLDLPVPPEAQRRDGTVILHLRFASAHVPAGDARALALACNAIEALVA